jgi:type IV secretion system protein VirB4
MKFLLRSQIENELARLDQKVQTFARQLADFMQIEVLDQQGQFRFLRRLLNYDEGCIAGRPQSTQFLDYQVALEKTRSIFLTKIEWAGARACDWSN